MTTQHISVPFRFGIAAALVATLPFSAAAYEWSVADGWNVRVDSEVSTGFQVRLQGRDCRIVAADNGGCQDFSSELINYGWLGAVPDFNYLQFDSGNLNYDAGDLVSWVLKGTHDLSVRGPDEWSGLVRFNWASDLAASRTANFDLPQDSENATNFDITLLDAWVSKGFEWFGQSAKVRVGNQVVSWGEDIFIPGGINVINAIDLRKFHTPGTALKEVFVPAPMAYLNTGVTEDLSAEVYYQFMWNGFRFDPVGTFFSAADIVGPGALPGYIPTVFGGVGDEHIAGSFGIPKLKDNRPSDQGQFGATLRYQLGEAEIAAHYVRYHDKLPQLSFTAMDGLPTGYFLDYGEERDLFGLSGNMPVTTPFGEVVLGAEVSYRPRDSVAIDPTVGVTTGPYSLLANSAANPGVSMTGRGFVEEEKWQAHVTANYLFSPDSPFGKLQEMVGGTDGWILLEAAFVNYPGLNTDGSVPYLLPDYSLPDKFSWGYVVEVGMTFPHIFGTPINFTPFIDYMHDVSGTSPNAVPFVESRKSLALNLGFNYLGKIKSNIVYAVFLDGGNNNLVRDRDFVGMSFTYAF